MDARQVFEAYERPPRAPHDRFRFCPVCGARLTAVGGEGAPFPKCDACGFVLFRNPGPGVVVLVPDGRRIVLCRRSSSFLTGKWCLPGGYIEFDEDFLSAGIREVREETNLDVEIVSIISVASNFLAPQVHTIATILLGRALGGEPRGGEDTDAAGWFSVDEALPELAFAADGHIIERDFAGGLEGVPVDARYARSRP